MGYSHYDAATRGGAAWNAGKTVGTKRPLTQKQIWAKFIQRQKDEAADRLVLVASSGNPDKQAGFGRLPGDSRRTDNNVSKTRFILKLLGGPSGTEDRSR